MRLICPNCDAQYEVPDDVIPVDGRDVQCSSCGQTWFQHHPDHMPPVAEPEPDPAEEVAPAPEPPARAAREIDPSIAEILRQEAAQEQKARAAETLESQPDLGLDDIPDPPKPDTPPAPPEPAAQTDPAPAPQTEDAPAAVPLGSRRNLLPDIEEINSTLRTEDDRAAGASRDGDADLGTVAEARQRSFRRGFALSITLVALLVGLYVATPRIIEAVPAAEPALLAYTQQVDAARLWLDGQVTRLLQWLDGMTA